MAELYSNPTLITTYKYPRPFRTNTKLDYKDITNGTTLTKIQVVGIPDGVSYLANEALVKPNTPRRLFIFSDHELTQDSLELLDTFYGVASYPISELYTSKGSTDLPKRNFYMTLSTQSPTSLSMFVEYRYLQTQYQKANICYDITTGNMFSFVPDYQPLIVLIMPQNFIKTSDKTGYFRFDNNITVRIFSDVLLSAGQSENDYGYKTDFTSSNSQLMKILVGFMSRLGLNQLHTPTDNQLVGYGPYFRAVVGNTNNINV